MSVSKGLELDDNMFDKELDLIGINLVKLQFLAGPGTKLRKGLGKILDEVSALREKIKDGLNGRGGTE